jgi:protein gp37
VGSDIEWTGETWNPLTGCDRISPGCEKCYALTLAARLKAMGQAKYQNDGDPRTSGPGFALTLHPDTLDIPLHWKAPRRVFVNSMSDLFHKDVPDQFIDQVFAVMALTQQHTFQVLTKRPQAMKNWAAYDFLSETRAEQIGQAATFLTRQWGWERPVVWDARTDERLRRDPNYDRRPWPGWPLPNVWLGTSIESDSYTFRADHLRDTPAAVRFLSLEPLLGPIPSLNIDGIDWVIVGGESGPGARPMHPDWVCDLRDRCTTAGVPFFFKQWGAWHDGSIAGRAEHVVTPDGKARTWSEWRAGGALLSPPERGRACVMTCVGKKAAGRELDGRTWDEMPG